MELPSVVRSALTKWSVFRIALLLGAVLVLPRLGAVGLWDPWETHYAEVGRQMLARGDLVHPYWQNAWFFSKPPLVAWLSALGLFVSGAQPWGSQGSGALPSGVEWFVRLPFALLFLFAGATLAETVARRATRRAGLLVALVWWTMPLVDFLARQVMTDGPFVSCVVLSLCFASNAEVSKRARDWALAFGFIGLAVLAKGLIGFLPAVIVLISWAVLEGHGVFARIREVPAWTSLLSVAIPAPWFIAMARFGGVDDEGRTFVDRFFRYDHLDRFTTGVHTTTPGGSFTYFIEQGAFAIFPWVLVVPLALHVFFTHERTGARWRLALTWAVALGLTFTLFTVSATRFHHYVMPMLPPLAVLMGLAMDALWDDVRAAIPAVVAGLVLFVVTAKDLVLRPRHWLDLFTYNHDRPYPNELVTQPLIAGAPSWLTLGGALTLASALVVLALMLAVSKSSGERAVRAVSLFATGVAVFLSWVHWPQLGRHWTQRELVERYYAERAPTEPLVAFFMNWKGETFYSRNEVTQVGARDPRGDVNLIVSSHLRSWFLVEQHRVEMLRSVLPPGARLVTVDAEQTNKFVLARVER